MKILGELLIVFGGALVAYSFTLVWEYVNRPYRKAVFTFIGGMILLVGAMYFLVRP